MSVPPRLALLLLRLTVSDAGVRDGILGDLEEDLASLAESGTPPRHTRLWYWRAFVGLSARFALRTVTGSRKARTARNRRAAGILAQTRKDTTGHMSTFLPDLRYALRFLRRTPGLSMVIVMTLAVGIGANVAMFGVVDAVLLQALPFPESDRLVLARTTVDGQLVWDASAEDYYYYRDQVEAFASLGAYRTKLEDVTLTGVDQPVALAATMVSVNLFQTLGVIPAVGRLFIQEDAEVDDPGDTTVPRAALISHHLWQEAFGGDPDVVGRTVFIDAWPSTVVGVMPAGFFFLNEVDAWWPLQPGGRYTGPRSYHVWTLVGRLSPGVSLEEAQSQVDVVSARLQRAFPESNAGKGLNVSPLHAGLVESYDQMLLTLTATIGLVLLVTCMNVAGLLVARGAGRRRELSVMAALGAGRGRLARQLLCESLLLAAAAGGLGTLLAVQLQHVALQIIPMDYVGVTELGLSGTMLTFSLVLSLGTTLAFGTIPAWLGSRATPAAGLSGSSRATQSGKDAGIRGGLVVLQVAFSLVLLIGSGLLVKSFVRLNQIDPGFRPEGLLTARVSVPFPTYMMPQSRLRFFSHLVEGVRAIPGVQAVGAAHLLPMVDMASQRIMAYNPENPPAGPSDQWITEHRQVLPGFFDAMGITLLAGRDFSDQDCVIGEPVLILNQTMAKDLFGEADPIGRAVAVDFGRGSPEQTTVVGIVADVRMLALDREPERQMYSPAGLFNVSASWTIAVRTLGDPADFTDAIRGVLHAIDPEVPLSHVSTMHEALARAVATPRVLATSLTLFAAMAMGLSLLGLYAILAFYVARRVREIGIRMAVGAGSWRIITLVLNRGLTLVAMGLVLGLGGAVSLTRLLRGQLYQVQPTDPVTFAIVIVLLAAVAVVACLFPAWRAATVDPVRALQTE